MINCYIYITLGDMMSRHESFVSRYYSKDGVHTLNIFNYVYKNTLIFTLSSTTELYSPA
jgi:hypothetical protein